MIKVSEFSSSTYSLIRKNVDLMTVAEVTLVALAIILLSDTLLFGVGASLIETGGIVCCSSALVIGVKEALSQKKPSLAAPSPKRSVAPPVPGLFEVSSEEELEIEDLYLDEAPIDESREHLNLMNSATLVACLQACKKNGEGPRIFTDPKALLDQEIPVPAIYDPLMADSELTTRGSVRGKLTENAPGLNIERELATIASFLKPPPPPKKPRSPVKPAVETREGRDFAPLREAVLRILTMGSDEERVAAKKLFDQKIRPKYAFDLDYIRLRASLIGQHVSLSNGRFHENSFVLIKLPTGENYCALVISNNAKEQTVKCIVESKEPDGQPVLYNFSYEHVHPLPEDLSTLAAAKQPLDRGTISNITLLLGEDLVREGKEEILEIGTLFDRIKPLPLEEDDRSLLHDSFPIQWGGLGTASDTLFLGLNITEARVPAPKVELFQAYLDKREILVEVHPFDESGMTIKLTRHKRVSQTRRPSVPPRERSSIRYIGPINSAQLLAFFKRNPEAPELVSRDTLLKDHIPPIGVNRLDGGSEQIEGLLDHFYLSPSKPDIRRDLNVVKTFPQKPQTRHQKEMGLPPQERTFKALQTSLLRVLCCGSTAYKLAATAAAQDWYTGMLQTKASLENNTASVPPELSSNWARRAFEVLFPCLEQKMGRRRGREAWRENKIIELQRQANSIKAILDNAKTWTFSRQDRPLFDAPFPVICEVNGSGQILGRGIKKVYTTQAVALKAWMESLGLDVEVVQRAF